MFARMLNRTTQYGVCQGVVILATLANAAAHGQAKKSTNSASKVTGKLVSLTKKGRSTILKVEVEDQGEREYTINARVEFAVQARGEKAFLTPGRFVRAEAVESNKLYFCKECTVLLAGRGKKPSPVFRKAPEAPGRSKGSYLVAGTVVSLQQDKDYPDYDALMVKVGSKTGKILMEKAYQVTVRTNASELAKAGATVALEGKTARGNRFLLTKATVTLDEPLKAEDFPSPGRSSRKSSKK